MVGGRLCPWRLWPHIESSWDGGTPISGAPDHRVRLRLKRPWSDGTYALELDALALLSRLAASVPPPRQHVVVYAGGVASNSRWRPIVIPAPAEQGTAAAATEHGIASEEAPPPAPLAHAPAAAAGASDGQSSCA